MVSSEDDDLVLPPWLMLNAPKRKKQVVSPEDFDLSQIVLVKLKTVKKAKNLSRVKFDKNKNKYAEIAIPAPDAIIGQV